MPPTTGRVRSPAAARARLITPTFVLAWLANTAQYILMYMLITTMALYAVKQFAAGEAMAGFASSAFVVGATVARIFTGYFVDRLGRRPVMLVSLVVATVICALYLPAGTLGLLILVRTLHGFAYAFASTALMAIAQGAIPTSRRAEGTGYFALGSTLAAAVGPGLALFVVNSLDYRTLFLICLGTAVAGMVFGFILREPGSGAAQSAETPAAAPVRAGLRLSHMLHPAVVPIGLFMLLIGLAYSGVITYLNGYAEQRSLVAGAGLFFAAYAVAMFLMRFVLGRVQDRHGDNVVVYFGLLFFALALGLLAMAHADWQVVLAGALTGLGYGSLMPAAQAIAVGSVASHELGSGISTLLLLADVGIGVGPVVLGYVVSRTGYGTMYWALAVVVVFALVFYRLTHGKLERAKRGTPRPQPLG